MVRKKFYENSKLNCNGAFVKSILFCLKNTCRYLCYSHHENPEKISNNKDKEF